MADYSYVAFLDILGYRNLLDADIKNGRQTFKDKMNASFRVFDEVNATNFSHQAISDSIFITCSDRSLVRELLALLQNVFCSFLNQGLLIRGGVSYGEHFQNRTITYSPALTKAYILESSLAEHPRVMVDSNIYEMFPEIVDDKIILQSGPNWFLNVINEENHKMVWDNARTLFAESREDIISHEKVRSKHRWLQDYIIEVSRYMQIPADDKIPYISIFDTDPPPRVIEHNEAT